MCVLNTPSTRCKANFEIRFYLDNVESLDLYSTAVSKIHLNFFLVQQKFGPIPMCVNQNNKNIEEKMKIQNEKQKSL